MTGPRSPRPTVGHAAASLLLSLLVIGCDGGGEKRSCGEGTVDQDGVCVPESTGVEGCGAGTELVGNTCVVVDVADGDATSDTSDAVTCDPECGVGYACVDGACVELEAPPAWTCSNEAYSDGATCDCACGAPDPDCELSGAPVAGCPDGVECGSDGTCGDCTPSCEGRSCGDNGCGGICGVCGVDKPVCSEAGTCVACVKDCADKDCGDDGCGGSCGDCEGSSICSEGQCVYLTDAESCAGKCGGMAPSGCSCEGDCLLTGDCCADAAQCTGDPGPSSCAGICGAVAEDGCSCASSCVSDGDCCDDYFAKCCEPQCDDKSCGDDGCGGVCGVCGVGTLCEAGECVADPCVPDPCHGNGTCDPADGSCSCEAPYVGEYCDACPPGTIGFPECVPDQCATSGQTCSGHGTCQPKDGSCQCKPGFGGVACDRCLDGTSVYPNCVDECASLECDDGNACTTDFCGAQPAYYFDCVDVMEQGHVTSGIYWIDPDGDGTRDPFQAWCDLETDGGGWTMCASDNDTVHLATERTYDPNHPYATDGYRSDCANVPFNAVLYVRGSDGAKAWFTQDSPPAQPVRLGSLEPAWGVPADVLGTFTGHGVADPDYTYELAVCDSVWMWTGLLMTSQVDGCSKACNDWCGDTAGPFFRYNGDYDGGGFIGVAFNENGHAALPNQLMSVGLRRRVPLKPAASGVGGYAARRCVHTLNTAPCDDSNACTEGDVCSAGACGGGKTVCDIAVTALDDTYDGVCSATHCSLREALAVANSRGQATTVGIAVGGQITLTGDGQEVASDTSVKALGQSVTINGDGKYRAFRFSGDASLRGLRIVRGRGVNGGAIEQRGGTLWLEDVVFEDNHAEESGGAVWASGKLDVRGCSFVANTATAAGGAVYLASGGTLDARRSSFEENTALRGGGVSLDGAGALVNCSVIDNAATEAGGGVAGTGSIVLLQTTLTGNHAPTASACAAATFDALNTLVVGSADPAVPLCASVARASTASVATDASCGLTVGDSFGTAYLIPAGVGTMVAFDSSPAFVDMGDTLVCQDPRVEGVDQYGVPRPLGGACDVGAFEYFSDFMTLVP